MSASQRFRLPRGGAIDRAAPLNFTFDGRNLSGYRGDTLASALLANGERLVGRSFKYHRPRGIVTAGSHEPNALVEIGTGAQRTPNTRATTAELYAGMSATSQNRWPSLRFDFKAFSGFFAPLLGAGFYYKTFMWPASFWEKVYEPVIRRMAGLGRLSGAADPDGYEHAFAFCDLLVIGGGPAGLMAALIAGRAGARVILCDDDFRLGGRLLAEREEIDGRPAMQWVAAVTAELKTMPDVRIMMRTAVFGSYDGGMYGALERVSDHLAQPEPFAPRQRYWRIAARRTVLAAGALERPLVFGGNDRPGVVQASAVRAYLNRFAVAPGSTFAVFTNNDDGWRTAADLIAAGQNVVAIIDSRKNIATHLRAPKTSRLLAGAEVIATSGRLGLRAISVTTMTGDEESIAADTLAISGGWDPMIALTSHKGARPIWNDDIAAFVPEPSGSSEMIVAGSAAGTFSLAGVLREGARVGEAATRELGFAPVAAIIPRAADEPYTITPLWRVAGSRGQTFVDLQNDVTAKDIGLAQQEGFRSVEHLKRYTTLGMATDQGKSSNINGLAILAALTSRTVPQTGTTVFRPPYVPVSVGALAGPHRGKEFRPVRLPPSHRWAVEQGADFVEVGPWLRARWFPRAGERDWLMSVDREVRTVRSSVGVCDVSTLGKIDLHGADAGIFLDRIYINTFSTLSVGKARYGVMLREDGFVMDDGTTSRLAEDHYYMTTTTGNAAKVMQHLEFCHQVLWPGLDVQMASVSEQWAQYSIAGPQARVLLCTVVDERFDLSNDALPYLGAREVTVCGGVAARVFRISFSGELAYEIAVPARYGDSLMRRLLDGGARLDAIPYGTEALGVMRIEKGHAAGNELNGQTTAADLGLGKMMAKKKSFVGKVMAQRPALTDPERPSLVGFKSVDAMQRLYAGAHFVSAGAAARPDNDEGYLTSVAHSPTLDCWIGLGLLRRGPQRLGERVRAYNPVRNSDTEVEVCAPAFVDPKGERLHG
jgi:heterotetrameric sarcosine oxidase alpha subunit